MKRIIVISLFLCVTGASAITAQEASDLSQMPGTFEILSRTSYAAPECGFTAADMTANLERIKEVVSVVRQNPVLSDIKGFNGRARIHTMSMTCKRPGWYGVPARIAFEFCSFFYSKEGKVVFNTIEPPSWSLYINDMIPGWSDLQDGKYGYFTVPLKMETIEPGIDVYDKERWIIYDPGRPPYWIPVTVEEAFNAAREFAAKEKDEYAAALNKQFLDQEWNDIPPEYRNKPAYFGGGISRVTYSSGYGGQDSIFPRIMKVNPEYFNRNLPKSAIQFMWFTSVQNKQYMKQRLDECIKDEKKMNDNFCSMTRFELSFGITDISNLSDQIGR